MLTNYLLAKNVAKAKAKNNSFYPLYTTALYSLLEKYPLFRDLVIKIFSSSNIYIEEDNLINIINKHNIDYIEISEDSDYLETSGISSGKDIVVFNQGEITHISNNPIIICSSHNHTQTEILNIFLHEMNHLIKGSIESFYFQKNDDEVFYVYRNGLNISYYQYDIETGNLTIENKWDILDEAINTIQTTELIKIIFSLSEVISDQDILSYINTLNYQEAKRYFGYEEASKLLRPLWNNTFFRDLIEDNIVNGDLTTIINTYNNIMGDNAFEDLGIAFDIIEESYQRQKHNKKYREAKKYIKNAIKKFPRIKQKTL